MAFVNLIPAASDYILLRNRQPELRKIGQKKSTSDMTFIEHLSWAASLLATPRGIGWAHEPTDHLPPRPTDSRGQFIASQFLWIMFYYILWDITLIHIQGNPCYRTGGPSLAGFGWWWRTTAWVYIDCTNPGIGPTSLDRPLTLTAFENVGADSRVWHQLNRRALTSNSNFLANAFRIPTGIVATYFKLFASFFISGLAHAAGDYVLHQDFSKGNSVQFFVLQAVGITFEDAVIAIASRLGYKQCTIFKLIGFIWVFAWFTFCMPMTLDPQVHAGMVDETKHISLIRVFQSFYERREIFKT
ncbi:hypothetical protein M413DRAFT_24765 [Hebeloma cylindrosporum]|uniref:Wax synthase domain-containing protein n=1 Tax=Hebeloma cylindrosporum TaxID=76867 RepID=A0A0C2Y702_HEBCY|nr:hypothetical protein M413DRAFT_24765 [Hebeloma cylindrosporum h7]